MSPIIEFISTLVSEISTSTCFGLEALGSIDTGTAASSSPLPFWASVSSVANSWQTLIAGVLAMLPASAAAVFVWKQLNEQRIQFLQIQKRDSQKSRLRLSRNLAEISEFLDSSYANLIKKTFTGHEHTVPEKLVEDVLDAGVLSGQSNFEFFKEYTIKIQQYSSLCRLYDEKKDENNLLKCFSTLAEIDIMTDHLYPFARFESDNVQTKEICTSEIKDYLLHNLRRGQDISGTNLEKLMELGRFE